MTEPKFAQGHVGVAPLWVFPHDGEINGSNGYLCVSNIDEMELKYQPGLTMDHVKKAYARAIMRVYNIEHEEAWESARELKGAWIVPHYVWAMVLPVLGAEMGSDSAQHAVNEAIQLMIASQAVLHIGTDDPCDTGLYDFPYCDGPPECDNEHLSGSTRCAEHPKTA